MNKKYIAPCIENLEYTETEELMGSVSSDYGIEYGGTDDGGLLDPAARTLTNIMFILDD